MVDPKQKIEVTNNSKGTVFYNSESFRIQRTWDAYGEKKLIPFEEIQDVCYTTGGRYLFENSYLLIRDAAVREELGLPVDKAYLLDKAGVIKLLAAPIAEFENVLRNAPNKVKELIANTAIEKELGDWGKLNIILETTGIDAGGQIKAAQVEKLAAAKAKAAPKGVATTKPIK